MGIPVQLHFKSTWTHFSNNPYFGTYLSGNSRNAGKYCKGHISLLNVVAPNVIPAFGSLLFGIALDQKETEQLLLRTDLRCTGEVTGIVRKLRNQ